MGVDAIFSSAASSLWAQRKAMEVTGENISNVNTPGYSRQQVILETGTTNSGDGFSLGSGVNVSAVKRVYDASITGQITDTNSDSSNSDTRLRMAQQVEPFFNELNGNVLGDAMQSFFNAWQALSLNPAGISERQTVLGRATVLTDTFKQINNGISSVQESANDQLTGVTTDITAKAKQVADLNALVSKTELINGNASDLRDKRDQVLSELSNQVGITYFERSDGKVDVNLLGGQTLVSGDRFATVYTALDQDTKQNAINPSNAIYISALENSIQSPNATRDKSGYVTDSIGGPDNSKGQIGALLYARDTMIPGYLNKLDSLAYNLTTAINVQHQAGYGLVSPLNGNPLFSAPGASGMPVVSQRYDSSTERQFKTGTITIDGGAGAPVSVAITSINNSLAGIAEAINSAKAGVTARVVTLGNRFDTTTQSYLEITNTSSSDTKSYAIDTGGLTTGPGAYAAPYFTVDGISSTQGVAVAITDTNALAASDTNPLLGSSGNNNNATMIAALVNKQMSFSGSTYASAGTFYNSIVSTIGVEIQSVQNRSDQNSAFLKQLNTLRDSVSSVSIDEELVNLIKYQKAFVGASKVINAATQMMDTVLGLAR